MEGFDIQKAQHNFAAVVGSDLNDEQLCLWENFALKALCNTAFYQKDGLPSKILHSKKNKSHWLSTGTKLLCFIHYIWMYRGKTAWAELQILPHVKRR